MCVVTMQSRVNGTVRLSVTTYAQMTQFAVFLLSFSRILKALGQTSQVDVKISKLTT